MDERKEQEKEGEVKKNLITEKVTGRKLTPGRALRMALVAAICGVAFGSAAFFAFNFLARRAPGPDSDEVSGHTDTGETAPEEGDFTDKNDRTGLTEAGSGSGEKADGGNADGTGAGDLSMADSGDKSAGDEGNNIPESTGSAEAESSVLEETDGVGSGTGESSESGGLGNAGTGTGHDQIPADGNLKAAGEGSGELRGGIYGEDEGSGGENSGAGDLGLTGTDTVPLSQSGMIKAAIRKSDSYLVSVNATSKLKTWFDSDTLNVETYSGVVISEDEKEILVLSPCSDIGSGDLSVTFSNGVTTSAYVKDYSASDSLYLLSLSSEQGISEETRELIEPVEYADTAGISNGDSVIAIGSPLGVFGSAAFGNVGYVSASETAVDSEQEIFYFDIEANAKLGTFIIDANGDLIGMVTPGGGDIGVGEGLTRAVSISSIRKIIESLEAGEERAYFGINGVGVNFLMKASNVPEGIYVSEVVQGGPAYVAGIRRGDVITVIDGAEVTDMEDFEEALDGHKPAEICNVTALRSTAGGEYEEVSFDVMLGVR